MKQINMTLTKNNKDRFKVSGFERQIYAAHLNEIMVAIGEKRMHNFLINVKESDGKYEIIDGQHRFYAMAKLLDEKKFDKFDIIVNIEDEKAELMERIRDYLDANSSKQLTMKDITKVYEEMFPEFFKKLSFCCSVYGSVNSMPYTSILAALRYAKTKSFGFGKGDILATFESITDEDILLSAYVMKNLRMIATEKTTNAIYQTVVFRNIFRIIYEYRWLITEEVKFQKFIRHLMNERAYQNSLSYSSESVEIIYNSMVKNL